MKTWMVFGVLASASLGLSLYRRHPRPHNRFRPCIDLHNGKVKQIVGSSLTADSTKDASSVQTNFETDKSTSYFASLYKKAGMKGGHIIMLGPNNQEAALQALRTYPGGMQVGGGITPDNAQVYLQAGASHVIVTSYVFKNGQVDMQRLRALEDCVGTEHLVLDLSCRRNPKLNDGKYYVVTDRWAKFTELDVSFATLSMLAEHCDEFLVHGVDVEGMRVGIDTELVALLARWAGSLSTPFPITYAGGASALADLDEIDRIGCGLVDLTIGSALDIFGGDIAWEDVVEWDQR